MHKIITKLYFFVYKVPIKSKVGLYYRSSDQVVVACQPIIDSKSIIGPLLMAHALLVHVGVRFCCSKIQVGILPTICSCPLILATQLSL